MLQRYELGFYEPGAAEMVAQTFTEVLELAKEEDGLTYDDIQEELMRDARAGLSRMPDEALWGVRGMAGNSIVVSEETLARPEFAEAGMDTSILVRSIERMHELRQLMIDEMSRRGVD